MRGARCLQGPEDPVCIHVARAVIVCFPRPCSGCECTCAHGLLPWRAPASPLARAPWGGPGRRIPICPRDTMVPTLSQ